MDKCVTIKGWTVELDGYLWTAYRPDGAKLSAWKLSGIEVQIAEVERMGFEAFRELCAQSDRC